MELIISHGQGNFSEKIWQHNSIFGWPRMIHESTTISNINQFKAGKAIQHINTTSPIKAHRKAGKVIHQLNSTSIAGNAQYPQT